MHTQSTAESAAILLVTEFRGHDLHAVCIDWPTRGLKVDLPQLVCEPPTQKCPAGHVSHSSADVRFVLALVLPGGQNVPAADPCGQ